METKIQSLRFENLSFGYEGHEPLFANVDFEFPMFQTVWIRAEGGQGRSSLLQLMAGLQEPSQGNYWINQVNVSEMSFEEFLPYRLKIGYGFDFGGLLNNKTIIENLTLPLVYHKILSANEAEQRAKSYMDEMGILKYQSQRPAVVPGGVRKLTCMIRALILHPELLLLDDPSVGLKEQTVLAYFDLIRKLKEQGHLQHVFVNSFDSKIMHLLGVTEILIDGAQLHQSHDEEKRLVNL